MAIEFEILKDELQIIHKENQCLSLKRNDNKREFRFALTDKAKEYSTYFIINSIKDKKKLLKLIKKYNPSDLLVLYNFRNFKIRVKEKDFLFHNVNFHEDLFTFSKHLSYKDFYKFLNKSINIDRKRFKLNQDNSIEKLFKNIINKKEFDLLKNYYIKNMYMDKNMYCHKTQYSVFNNYSIENENSDSILIHELGHLILAYEFGFDIEVVNINNFMPFIIYQMPKEVQDSEDESVIKAMQQANIIISCAGLANESLYTNNKFGKLGKMFGAKNDIDCAIDEYINLNVDIELDELYNLSVDTLKQYDIKKLVSIIKNAYGHHGFVLYQKQDVEEFIKLVNLMKLTR